MSAPHSVEKEEDASNGQNLHSESPTENHKQKERGWVETDNAPQNRILNKTLLDCLQSCYSAAAVVHDDLTFAVTPRAVEFCILCKPLHTTKNRTAK